MFFISIIFSNFMYALMLLSGTHKHGGPSAGSQDEWKG